MKKLMTAVLTVCPKVRGSASDLRQVDVRSRALRSVPAAAVQEDGALGRDRFQFCSGLVDLVVCVGRHLGGGHRLTLVGERFVGLVAETSQRSVIAVVILGITVSVRD
jgi:hypothetical protein